MNSPINAIKSPTDIIEKQKNIYQANIGYAQNLLEIEADFNCISTLIAL